MDMSARAKHPLSDDARVCLHPAAVRRARESLATAPPATEIAALFAILGDGTRLRILLALGSAELCVRDLAAATGINCSTVSHRRRILHEGRLVERRRQGKVVHYSLADEHVATLLQMGSAHTGRAADNAADVAQPWLG